MRYALALLLFACEPKTQEPVVLPSVDLPAATPAQDGGSAPIVSPPASTTPSRARPNAGSKGDRDGDGVPDNADKCPDEPEDFDGFEDADGCPDHDNDHDGVLDVDDRCPNVYGPAPDGCPRAAKQMVDRDGDGVPDNVDMCPDAPEDRDGFQDNDGCPDPDNDKDGILDVNDQCPNQPGRGPSGCP